MAVERYRRELRRREARIAELEKVAAEGQATVTSFHAQQRALFDKFCTLRQKYDGVKAHLREVLWDYIPSCRIPAVEGRGPAWLEAIPEVDRSLAEDKDRVGPYLLGEVLGEGQFAAVRGVRMRDGAGAARQLAVKMIDKSGVVNVTTLRRVDNEIASLQRLDHPGIMRLYDVVHAPQCIYMITDKAGQDLFEFFDAHLDGVSEAIAAQLLAKIMDPVAYCHAQGICHRDLKPENILFAEKGAFTAASRVLLCDFGLCARVETDAEEAALRRAHAAPRALHEFCGSPGFFAPEMLVRGAYDGKKADAWSLGCILLELVLGHEDFCRLWVSDFNFAEFNR
ncbi:kinase-like domain-containing protein [Tribonema minus]|uniref:Kinase-like domain-containing protein n=1 Tax=Tribonema minus TaxID=303371 RepID=A0A835Z6B8_9STRA|nr:kinase-like domain-containing protein [Tribonema minus]